MNNERQSIEIARNAWPYCDAPGCHDSRVSRYLRGPLSWAHGATVGPGQGRDIHCYEGPGSPSDTRTRACRIHALQQFGTAVIPPGVEG